MDPKLNKELVTRRWKRQATSWAGRVRDAIHPRRIVWQYLQRFRTDRPVIAKLQGGLRMRIYPHDVIGAAIYQNGVFEPREVDFVTSFLRPGMVFLDIGANLGQYSLRAAQCVGPSGQVHSFEPSERMFSELRFNVDLNALSDICSLNRLAVSSCVGRGRLSRYEIGAEVYGSLGSQHRSESNIIGYEDVAVTTIDTYVEIHKLECVHLIKLDIEGAELLALKGGHRLLSGPKAPTLLLEMADINTIGFGHKAIDAWDYLSSLGYEFFAIAKKGALSRARRPCDFSSADNLVAAKGSRP